MCGIKRILGGKGVIEGKGGKNSSHLRKKTGCVGERMPKSEEFGSPLKKRGKARKRRNVTCTFGKVTQGNHPVRNSFPALMRRPSEEGAKSPSRGGPGRLGAKFGRRRWDLNRGYHLAW